jgi:hypothetical protein
MWKIERKNLNFRTHLKRYASQKMNKYTIMLLECILNAFTTKPVSMEIVKSDNLRQYQGTYGNNFIN